jgi:predicted metal-dependent peptidase
MKLSPEIQNLISASLLRLRTKSPFFATLALFTNFQASELIPTAGTDGRDIFINEEFARSLPSGQLDGVLLHEVLHAALLHVWRRGSRDPQIWNIAADIVVNGMIIEQRCFELPEFAIRDRKTREISCRGNL